jgi:BlaI family transcriptional regulator, penicillinase repressor
MPRPRNEQPTPAELEVLQILWDRGPGTVRDVMEALNEQRPRAYTSVMSLLNVMTDKGLLRRKPVGRAFLYSARHQRQETLGGMVTDLLDRAFAGSPNALVSHLLAEAQPTQTELDEIRKAIETYRSQHPREGA